MLGPAVSSFAFWSAKGLKGDLMRTRLSFVLQKGQFAEAPQTTAQGGVARPHLMMVLGKLLRLSEGRDGGYQGGREACDTRELGASSRAERSCAGDDSSGRGNGAESKVHDAQPSRSREVPFLGIEHVFFQAPALPGQLLGVSRVIHAIHPYAGK